MKKLVLVLATIGVVGCSKAKSNVDYYCLSPSGFMKINESEIPNSKVVENRYGGVSLEIDGNLFTFTTCVSERKL